MLTSWTRHAVVALIALAPLPSLAAPILLKPAQVFDGEGAAPHPGWRVLVEGERKAVFEDCEREKTENQERIRSVGFLLNNGCRDW